MGRLNLRPDLLRSLLITFGLYFLFRQRVPLLGETSFYALGAAVALLASSALFVLAHEQRLRFDPTNGLLLLYGLAFGLVYLGSGQNFMAAFLTHLAVNVQAWAINVRLMHRSGRPLLPNRLNWQALWGALRP